MKKILIAILLILIIPVFAHAKVKVSDLYPAYKVYTSATKSISVPSKITLDNVLKTSKTIALKLKQPRIAALGTLLALNGLIYVGEKVYDYIIEQSSDPVIYDKAGELYKSVPGTVPTPSCRSSCIADPDITVVKGTYKTAAEATAARNAATNGAICTLNSEGKYSYPCYSGTAGDGMYCVDHDNNYYVFSRYAFFWESESSHKKWSWLIAPSGTPVQNVEVPATSDDIKKALNDGLDLADDDAKDISEKIVDQSATAYDESNPAVTGARSLSGSKVADQVKTAVDEALEDEENYPSVVELTDAGANVSDNDIVDKAEEDEASDLSIAGIYKAFKSALLSFFGDLSPVDVAEPTFNDPEKSNLTEILSDFTSSINSLPIMNTLNGISVSCGGSSSLCLYLPQKYGGTVCYSGANIQDTLNAIGTACLSIITLISCIYIFRG